MAAAVAAAAPVVPRVPAAGNVVRAYTCGEVCTRLAERYPGGLRDVRQGLEDDDFVIDYQTNAQSFLVASDTHVSALITRLLLSAYFPQPGRPYYAIIFHEGAVPNGPVDLRALLKLRRACERLDIPHSAM